MKWTSSGQDHEGSQAVGDAHPDARAAAPYREPRHRQDYRTDIPHSILERAERLVE